MNQMFLLPKAMPREQKLAGIASYLAALTLDKAWRIEVSEAKGTRSQQQNRYLWGVCYAMLIAKLPGWDAEDVHEYMLGEHFGWEMLEGMGRKRLRPLKRSGRLSTTEFSDFIAFVQRKAAEHGVVIPDPDKELMT